MSLIIDEQTIGLWYVPIPDGNWLATLNYHVADAVLNHRFRYFRNGKIHHSEDSKSHYRTDMTNIARMKTIENVRLLVRALEQSKSSQEESVELLRNSMTIDEFMARVTALPFMRTRIRSIHQPGHA